MDKLHITQDDHGYWMLSHEQEDGTLTLLAHQFATPDHLIENANEMIAEGRVKAVVLIDPPRHTQGRALSAAPDDYQKPAPRRAGV
ncbi:MAG TPA: hypothetical protein VMO26_04795 [Vicinamibacterales bacterium]|nr:hypothetical protein [Vicinamibacterales bacterium]